MRVFQILISNLVLIFVVSVLAFAQTETPKNSAPNKIATIDTDLFYDEKAGIPELAKAKKQFDAEVDPRFETEIKPKNDELDILLWKIRGLNTQIQNLKDRNLDSWDKEIELGRIKSRYLVCDFFSQ